MAHALLLSPDDQAVNAITGVLEEMSVTCERPLDGVSAAHKLNSTNFDLVLVDCENLPAAKLIFDVCRRGNNGISPVPIAIVDGRAGLPTAFRLGAELILTKPVAKDQARSTIRTAVSRVRKDVPTNDTASAQLASAASASGNEAGANAGASSHLTSFTDPVPSYVSSSFSGVGLISAPNSTNTATLSAAGMAANLNSTVEQMEMAGNPESLNSKLTSTSLATSSLTDSSSIQFATASSNIVRPAVLSNDASSDHSKDHSKELTDDALLADFERMEQEASKRNEARKRNSTLEKTPVNATRPKPAATAEVAAYSSRHRQQKTKASIAALAVLVLVVCGFYTAWMYQPGFQAIAQPKIDRLLALAGMALPATPNQDAAKLPARPASAPPPALPISSNNTPATAVDSTSASTIELATGPASSATLPSAATASASAPTPATPSTAVATLATGKAIAAAPSVTKPAIKSSETTKDSVPEIASAAGDDSPIVLSSKGAEKRLTYSVAPKYPVEAMPGKDEGTVVLRAVIDEAGKIGGVRLVEGNATLATAAIQAVKQWRYRPYLRDGKAQPFQTVVIVDFQRP